MWEESFMNQVLEWLKKKKLSKEKMVDILDFIGWSGFIKVFGDKISPEEQKKFYDSFVKVSSDFLLINEFTIWLDKMKIPYPNGYKIFWDLKEEVLYQC